MLPGLPNRDWLVTAANHADCYSAADYATSLRVRCTDRRDKGGSSGDDRSPLRRTEDERRAEREARVEKQRRLFAGGHWLESFGLDRHGTIHADAVGGDESVETLKSGGDVSTEGRMCDGFADCIGAGVFVGWIRNSLRGISALVSRFRVEPTSRALTCSSMYSARLFKSLRLVFEAAPSIVISNDSREGAVDADR
jgi:hypothetical protein